MPRLALVCIALCSTALVPMPLIAATSIDETIIALERGAMDRWGMATRLAFSSCSLLMSHISIRGRNGA